MTEWRKEAEELKRRLDDERRERERALKEERELLLRNRDQCLRSANSLRSKVSRFCKEFAKSIDCGVRHEPNCYGRKTLTRPYDPSLGNAMFKRRDVTRDEYSDDFCIYSLKPRPQRTRVECHFDSEWSVTVRIGFASNFDTPPDLFVQVEPCTARSPSDAHDPYRCRALTSRIGASSYTDDKLGAALIALIDKLAHPDARDAG